MRFLDALERRTPDRIPFVPAILEHKAFLVGSVPARLSRDAGLLVQATLREYDLYQADALVVAIDPYNVVAEAVGARVQYPGNDDPAIPSMVAGGEALPEGTGIDALRLPDPLVDGRMPMHLEAAEQVQRAIGSETVVRGALSGPFSTAAGLMGAENLLMAVHIDTDLVRDVLGFCIRTLVAYGREYLRRGCGLVIYESHASPEVISPATYNSLVLEPTRELIGALRQEGARNVPLIIGGNTEPILGGYIKTGANNILCDFRAPMGMFLEQCRGAGIAFRRNLDSTGFLTDLPEEVHRLAVAEIAAAGGYPGFILGTGVIPFGTPAEILDAVRAATLGQ